MTIRWPCEVLAPQNIAIDLAPRSLAGPASVSGKTQVVSSDAGLWKVTYGNLIVRSRNAVLAHRAIAALLEGRLGTILVPICRAYQPLPQADGLFEEVPHDDDAFFDDDTGYVGGATNITLNDDVAARAVSCTVTVNYGNDPEPGQHFSVDDGRMYRVRTYDADTGVMTFRPPAREAIDAGTELEFDDPVVRCRLASDKEMDLELQLRRFGNPTVQFIEDC